MRADIRKRYDRAAVGQRIGLQGMMDNAVEADGRDVEGLVIPGIVEIFIGHLLAHVDAHADGVHDKVDLPEVFFGLIEEAPDVVVAASIGPDERAAGFFGQEVEGTQAFGHGSVRKHEASSFPMHRLRDGPGKAAFIERTENDTRFSFKKTVSGMCHGIPFASSRWWIGSIGARQAIR